MAQISAQQAGGINVLAFLDMLAWSEGTSTSRVTINSGYDVIVTGHDGAPEVFADYSNHPFANGRPSKVINSKGLTSNAAGRYPQMLKDWPHYRDQLKLPDFGPVSQDRLAIQHIKECGAFTDIQAGRFSVAIGKCSNIWASLPGNTYGQRMHPIELLVAQCVLAGGVTA